MARPFEVTLTIDDDKGKHSFANFYIQYDYPDIPATATFEQVEAGAQYMAGIIDNLVNGKITNISITRQVELPGGLKGLPSIAADVEEKGVFVFGTATVKVKITLPSFKDSLVISGTQDIDQTDADVVLFIFAVTDGSASPMDFINVADNRDDTVFQFHEAYERFNKSGK